MTEEIPMKIIARYQGDLKQKFGVPRQAGLVEALEGRIVFEPAYRNGDALRGVEGFSHLWLLWAFSLARREDWSPTVRPPRLGGNDRLGVFATRSPFRPNPIGLSCVRLLGVEQAGPDGPVLRVAGADLVSGTPIFDIKPYLPYADCRPEALGGFAPAAEAVLPVEISPTLLARIPPERQQALVGILAQDPRPRYQEDPERVYGLSFAGLEVKFRVAEGTVTVCGVEREQEGPD